MNDKDVVLPDFMNDEDIVLPGFMNDGDIVLPEIKKGKKDRDEKGVTHTVTANTIRGAEIFFAFIGWLG